MSSITWNDFQRQGKGWDDFKNAWIEECVVSSGEVFNDWTYSQWLREWLIWLYSSSPTYEGYRGEACFLHGNISYFTDPDSGDREQSEKTFQNRAGTADEPGFFLGEVIYPDTPIFFPVMSAFYSVNERYYGGMVLSTIRECQNICRRDIDEGGRYWCEIRKKGWEDKIDLRGSVVRVESGTFQATVAEYSPLRYRFEMPIEPGTYETYCIANCLLITDLFDEGIYRLTYGGYGRGRYKSDSVVDLIVDDQGRRFISSGSKRVEETLPRPRPLPRPNLREL